MQTGGWSAGLDHGCGERADQCYCGDRGQEDQVGPGAPDAVRNAQGHGQPDHPQSGQHPVRFGCVVGHRVMLVDPFFLAG